MSAPEGNLQVNVVNYKPHVACDSRAAAPSLSSCRRLVDEMPVGKHSTAFTKQPQHGQSGIKLPRTYSDCKDIANHTLIRLDKVKGLTVVDTWTESNPCTFTIDTSIDAPPTRATHFDLWAAAVAISEICVRIGQNGEASMLGQSAARKPLYPLSIAKKLPASRLVHIWSNIMVF